LLEGLEVSEVRYLKLKDGNDIFRLDSEPFQKVNKLILNKIQTLKLNEIAFSNPSKNEIANLNISLLVSFVPMAMLGNGIINEKEDKLISDFIKTGYTYFAENDILIAKITPCMEHGKCAIARNLTNGIGFGSTEYNVFRVKDNRILTEYLFTYLNRDIIRKKAENNMIGTSGRQRVPTTFYENLQIPIIDIKIQKKIKIIIDDSHTKNKESELLYTQAEQLLLKELGLKDWQPSTENINCKSFKESFFATGRLDAEYYQPKYEDYNDVIMVNQQGYSFIRNEFEHINESPKLTKKGYNYIEIGDVNTGDGTNVSNYIETKELPANAKTFVKKGDLLISKVRPYRGAVTIIESDLSDIIVSGAFTVLRSKEESTYSNEVLKVILRLDIYKDWLLQFNVGTQYPVIKDDDILNLPIPIISEKTQQVITEKINESQHLKHQSEQLLEIAKRAVEIAVEEDEEKAIEYINKNVTT